MSETTSNKLRSFSIRKYIAAIVLLAFVFFNIIFTPGFASWATLTNIFNQSSKVALLALGMTLVIATGGIDVSVGSTMAFGSIIAAKFFIIGQPVWGIIISILAVLLMGLLTGVIVAKLKVLPLVATLSFMYIMRGLAMGISGVGTITFKYTELQELFINPFLGRLPIQFFIVLVAVIVTYIIVNRMKYGTQIEACGNNPMAARICGINIVKVVIIAYVVCALFAWLSGMLEAAMISASDPSKTGKDMEMNAIAAVVIGGTPITGGAPNVIGSVCGAFLLQLITMMANMNNLAYSITLIIKAGIIVFALYFHGIKRK